MYQDMYRQVYRLLAFVLCRDTGKMTTEQQQSPSGIFGRHTEEIQNNTLSDGSRFFKAWWEKPLQIAALTPSGAALAQLMTRELLPGAGKILELGPGTGVFTRAILARGIREENITLIEYEEVFAQLLSLRFPDATVLQMDASTLTSDMRFRQGRFDAVISGLPLLSMGPRRILRLLTGSFCALGPGGMFYQFTYGPFCPISRKILDRLGLKATRLGGTVANLPPASVYRISRRSAVHNSSAAYFG